MAPLAPPRNLVSHACRGMGDVDVDDMLLLEEEKGWGQVWHKEVDAVQGHPRVAPCYLPEASSSVAPAHLHCLPSWTELAREITQANTHDIAF